MEICGESIAEVNKVMQGHADGDLTEIGYIQSQLLSFRLSYAKFTEIICSDSERAKQSIKEIINYHKQVPIEFDSKLRERSLGTFEGKSFTSMKIEANKKGINLREFKPTGGESWKDVYERSRMFIDRLIIKYVKKDFSEQSALPLFNKMSAISRSQTISKPLSGNLNYSKTTKIADNSISLVKRDVTLDLNNFNNLNISKTFKETHQEDVDYTSIDLNQLFSNENFCKKISKIYKGFNSDLNFPRVLLVSHSGFIMEFLNNIRIRKNIRLKFINDSLPTSLYIIKIYCVNCGSMCYSKDEKCKLEYDMIIYNNVDHLNFIIS